MGPGGSVKMFLCKSREAQNWEIAWGIPRGENDGVCRTGLGLSRLNILGVNVLTSTYRILPFIWAQIGRSDWILEQTESHMQVILCAFQAKSLHFHLSASGPGLEPLFELLGLVVRALS